MMSQLFWVGQWKKEYKTPIVQTNTILSVSYAIRFCLSNDIGIIPKQEINY